MTSQFRTRWAVIAFVLLGVLVALILLVRDLGDGDNAPEENGTAPAVSR